MQTIWTAEYVFPEGKDLKGKAALFKYMDRIGSDRFVVTNVNYPRAGLDITGSHENVLELVRLTMRSQWRHSLHRFRGHGVLRGEA